MQPPDLQHIGVLQAAAALVISALLHAAPQSGKLVDASEPVHLQRIALPQAAVTGRVPAAVSRSTGCLAAWAGMLWHKQQVW